MAKNNSTALPFLIISFVLIFVLFLKNMEQQDWIETLVAENDSLIVHLNTTINNQNKLAAKHNKEVSELAIVLKATVGHIRGIIIILHEQQLQIDALKKGVHDTTTTSPQHRRSGVPPNRASELLDDPAFKDYRP